MSGNPADFSSSRGSTSPWTGGRVAEFLDESECLRLIGAAVVGRVGYTSRYGPAVMPVKYKLHEGSIVFHALPAVEEDLRTGIADAEYQVAFEVDQFDPDTLDGWTVHVRGSAHHVDTETERASITSAEVDPWPKAESEHIMRVLPNSIIGRRIHRA